MDVLDAINLLKKYNKYDEAESECKRKKVSTAPYDMKGHHEIYCSYLSKIWRGFRDQLEKAQKRECVEWNNLPCPKPLHNNCAFISVGSLKNHCKNNCTYYLQTIKPLEDKMLELSEAQEVLKDAADKDEALR